MTQNNAYNQYREDAIFTSGPEELTLMLYNGLIKFIMQAQSAILGSDLEKANNSMIKAQNIILYFINTLDMKYEISDNLVSLYDFMYRRLIDANLSKDQETLTEVLDLSRELRDTWGQAMKIARKSANTKVAQG